MLFARQFTIILVYITFIPMLVSMQHVEADMSPLSILEINLAKYMDALSPPLFYEMQLFICTLEARAWMSNHIPLLWADVTRLAYPNLDVGKVDHY